MIADNSMQIELYCKRVIRSYRSQKDVDRAPRWKVSASSPDLDRDLKWLVEKQVMGRSGRQIAVFEGVDERTVNTTVRKLLVMLGLPARRGSRYRRVTDR